MNLENFLAFIKDNKVDLVDIQVCSSSALSIQLKWVIFWNSVEWDESVGHPILKPGSFPNGWWCTESLYGERCTRVILVNISTSNKSMQLQQAFIREPSEAENELAEESLENQVQEGLELVPVRPPTIIKMVNWGWSKNRVCCWLPSETQTHCLGDRWSLTRQSSSTFKAL